MTRSEFIHRTALLLVARGHTSIEDDRSDLACVSNFTDDVERLAPFDPETVCTSVTKGRAAIPDGVRCNLERDHRWAHTGERDGKRYAWSNKT